MAIRSQQFPSHNTSPSSDSDFMQSDFSTETEQDDAIIAAMSKGGGTGIQPHSYQGHQQGLFYTDIISPLSLGSPLYESNGGDFIPGRGGRPIFNYPPDALLDCLAVYNKSKHTNYLLESYRDFVWSDKYFFYVISLPYNTTNALITWKQTYRDQIDIPPKSYLIAIQAGAFSYDGERQKFITPTTFKVQIYDDGAGEYLFNAPVRSNICAGNDTPVVANGNAFGPFMLASPLSIVPNGMMVVSMTNIEATGTAGSATDGAINAYLGLIFAIPKNNLGNQVPKG